MFKSPLTIKKAIFSLITFISLIFGLYLRTHFLNVTDPVNDELWTVDLSSINQTLSVVIEKMKGAFVMDPNPPLYYCFMHIWIKIFGPSLFSIRLPSALSSCATIFLALYFLKTIEKDNTSAYIATIFFSLCSGAIYYADIARSYSLLILFTVLFLISKYSAEKNKTKTAYFIHAINSIILANIHFFGTLFVFSSVIETVFYHRKNKGGSSSKHFSLLILSEFIGPMLCILYLLYYASYFMEYLYPKAGSTGNIPFKSHASISLIKQTVFTFFNAESSIIIFILIIASYLFFMGNQSETDGYFSEKNRKAFLNTFRSIGGLTSILSVVISTIISFKVPMMNERNLFIILPTLIFTLSILSSYLLKNGRLSALAFFILISLFIYSSTKTGIEIITAPTRENTDYRFFSDYLNKVDAVFSSNNTLLKIYMTTRSFPETDQAKIYYRDALHDKTLIAKMKNIAVFDTVTLKSLIDADMETIKSAGFTCKYYCPTCTANKEAFITLFFANCSRK